MLWLSSNLKMQFWISLQSDPDVASCLNAYVDARKRLLDKAKGRGFWGPSKNNKGKGKGKFKGGFRLSSESL